MTGTPPSFNLKSIFLKSIFNFNLIARLLFYGVLGALAFLVLVPLIWLVAATTKSSARVGSRPSGVSQWPGRSGRFWVCQFIVPRGVSSAALPARSWQKLPRISCTPWETIHPPSYSSALRLRSHLTLPTTVMWRIPATTAWSNSHLPGRS